MHFYAINDFIDGLWPVI